MTISTFSEGALLLFKQNFKSIHWWYSAKQGALKIKLHRKTPVLESLHLYSFIFTAIPKFFWKFAKERQRHIAVLKLYFHKQARFQKYFIAGEVSWNWGTSISTSSETQKRPAGKKFAVFFLDTLATRWKQSGFSFFSKINAFFSIFKKRQGRPPPPP